MFKPNNEHRTEEAFIEAELFGTTIWRSGDEAIHGNHWMVIGLDKLGVSRVRPPRKFYSDALETGIMQAALQAQGLNIAFVEEVTTLLCIRGQQVTNYQLFQLMVATPECRAIACFKVLTKKITLEDSARKWKIAGEDQQWIPQEHNRG